MERNGQEQRGRSAVLHDHGDVLHLYMTRNQSGYGSIGKEPVLSVIKEFSNLKECPGSQR